MRARLVAHTPVGKFAQAYNDVPEEDFNSTVEMLTTNAGKFTYLKIVLENGSVAIINRSCLENSVLVVEK